MSAGAEAADTAAATTKTRPRRGYWSPLARAMSLIPLYLLLYPFVKMLELFGRWPRAISRGMARTMENFEGYEPGAQDVLVCSYFKSGTN